MKFDHDEMALIEITLDLRIERLKVLEEAEDNRSSLDDRPSKAAKYRTERLECERLYHKIVRGS